MRTREDIESDISELEDSLDSPSCSSSCSAHEIDLDSMRCRMTDLRVELGGLDDAELHRLDQERYIAFKVADDLHSAKYRYIDVAEKAVRETAETIYGEDIRKAERKKVEATLAFEKEKIRLASVDVLIGRKVQKPNYRRFSRNVEGYTPGVLELMTHETPMPDHVQNRPEMGTLFVRLLKKNGQPSLLFYKYHPYSIWELVEE